MFTYTVSDGSMSDVAIVTVTVTADNDPPAFTSVPVENALEDVAYTYNATADDMDMDDVLTITALLLPPWLSMSDNDNGAVTLSGTPTSADVGHHNVGLQVQDTTGLTDTQTFTITVTASDGADLDMSKSVNNSVPSEGDTIVYTLLVTNYGPSDATQVVISDTLPNGVTYDSDDSGGDYSSVTGVWNVGDLSFDDSATLHITATVDEDTAGKTITNTAVIIASAQPDPILDNGDDSAIITVARVRIYLPLVLKHH